MWLHLDMFWYVALKQDWFLDFIFCVILAYNNQKNIHCDNWNCIDIATFCNYCGSINVGYLCNSKRRSYNTPLENHSNLYNSGCTFCNHCSSDSSNKDIDATQQSTDNHFIGNWIPFKYL